MSFRDEALFGSTSHVLAVPTIFALHPIHSSTKGKPWSVNLGDWWMALSGSCFKYLFFQSIFGMIVPNHYLISFQLVWNGLTPPTTSCRSWPSDPFSPGRGYWVQKHQPPQCCGFELHCLQSTVEPTGASGFELASHEAQHGRYVWAHSKLKGHWITECIQKTSVTFNNWVFISHCFG